MSKLNNIFLFDVDGTLSVQGVVPTSAKQTLAYLKTLGDSVFLCTGRSLGQMKNLLEDIPVDGIIANNGAYAFVNGKPFYDKPIPHRDIIRLLDKGLCVGVLTKDSYGVLQEQEDILKTFCDYFSIARPISMDISMLRNEKIYSLGVYTKENITNTIKELDSLHFMKVCPVGYDVVVKGVSKASAIRALRELYPQAKMIGFGDNYNDRDMLLEVDTAIVMPTAPKEIQALADAVTKDPLKDGIQYAIKELLRL